MGGKRRNTCLNLTEAAPGPKLRRVSQAGRERHASGTDEQGGICIEAEGQGQTPLVHRRAIFCKVGHPAAAILKHKLV